MVTGCDWISIEFNSLVITIFYRDNESNAIMEHFGNYVSVFFSEILEI